MSLSSRRPLLSGKRTLVSIQSDRVCQIKYLIITPKLII